MSDKLSFADDCVLHFAMRYALGRKTGAVGVVCKVILRDWERLTENTRQQMKREIRDALDNGLAGEPCDVAQWEAVLKLP